MLSYAPAVLELLILLRGCCHKLPSLSCSADMVAAKAAAQKRKAAEKAGGKEKKFKF